MARRKSKTPGLTLPDKSRPWGQVETLPSGEMRARYTGPDGQRYDGPRLFDALVDAHAWLRDQHKAIRDGRWTPATAAAAQQYRGRTLGEFAVAWLATRLNRNGEPLRPRTRVEYERLIAGPLAGLATHPLRSLTAATVGSWYREQLATGHATQAARAYGLLNSIMKAAVQQKAIAENPCAIRGAGSATTGKKVEPPTPVELDKIVAAIAPRFRAAILIAAWAGTRYGELTELRRKDVTIARDGREVRAMILNVDRAVTNTTGHGFIVGKTKSEAGVRSIALPPHIFPTVLEHLKKHVADFPDSLLFPGADGITHLAQTAFYKHWDKARRAAGRGDMPFHALRHHGATRFAQTGATLKEIQARLGHSTVEAAMRYQHAAGRDEELARRMSDLAQKPGDNRRQGRAPGLLTQAEGTNNTSRR